MPTKPILPIRQDDSDDSKESYYDEQGELPLRHAYIHSLANLLHACLLRGDIDRAKRAWAILVSIVHVSLDMYLLMRAWQIRCREVDWRARWQWGLLFLSSGSSDAVQNTQASMYASQAEDDYRQAERWINTLRVSARMEDVSLPKACRIGRLTKTLETISPARSDFDSHQACPLPSSARGARNVSPCCLSTLGKRWLTLPKIPSFLSLPSLSVSPHVCRPARLLPRPTIFCYPATYPSCSPI